MNSLAVLERAKGIEPSYAAWEAAVLPLNYARQIKYLRPVSTRNVLPFVLTLLNQTSPSLRS